MTSAGLPVAQFLTFSQAPAIPPFGAPATAPSAATPSAALAAALAPFAASPAATPSAALAALDAAPPNLLEIAPRAMDPPFNNANPPSITIIACNNGFNSRKDFVIAEAAFAKLVNPSMICDASMASSTFPST